MRRMKSFLFICHMTFTDSVSLSHVMELPWYQSSKSMLFIIILIPSLPQTVTFPSWKLNTHACQHSNSVCCSPITSLISTLRILMKILSHASGLKKENKKDEGFQISLCYWLVSSDVMAVNRLTLKSSFVHMHSEDEFRVSAQLWTDLSMALRSNCHVTQ